MRTNNGAILPSVLAHMDWLCGTAFCYWARGALIRASGGSGAPGAGDIAMSGGLRRLLRRRRWRLPVASEQSREREKSRNE